MILAAGLGTRLRPLSLLRAKPAMPVLGRPVIAYLLELLHHHGVREVMVNLHHLPDGLRAAIGKFCPHDMRVHYSPEEAPLGTGGAVRRALGFLRESDPALVLAGDMLLDADLTALVDRHRRLDSHCTLLLADDPRRREFGSIGVDDRGCVRRIADRFDLGGESGAGVFLGVRVLSPPAYDSLPEREAFEDLSDWLAPALARGLREIRGVVLAADRYVWRPVGSPAEYLRANLQPPRLSFLSRERMIAPGTRVSGSNSDVDVVVGAHARLGAGVRLAQSVVWDEENVPAGFRGERGVFAGGTFYACGDETTMSIGQESTAVGEQQHE